MRFDIDDTRHDAAYQAQLDADAARDSCISRRTAEIAEVMVSGGPDSGLADCLAEIMDDDLAEMIRATAFSGPTYSHWQAGKLRDQFMSRVHDYAKHLATAEADNPTRPDLTDAEGEQLRRSA